QRVSGIVRARITSFFSWIGIGVAGGAWFLGSATVAIATESSPPESAATDSTTALEGLPIDRVDIQARNIFDPLPRGTLGSIYSLLKHLHVPTGEETIRRQLLFSPGDRWREGLARETERNLRDLHYVVPRRILAKREGDSVAVRVETQDTWTTSFRLGVEGA